MTPQKLESISSTAKKLNNKLLTELIDQNVRRMSEEHKELSNGLNALENLHHWRTSAEWAIQHGLTDLANQAIASLEKNLEQCSSCVSKFGGATAFLTYATTYINRISTN